MENTPFDAFVITISSLEESINAAHRLKESAPFRINIFDARTPYNCDVEREFELRGISFKKFLEFDLGAKPLNVACCFISHLMLWEYCIVLDHPIFIFEHDAVFTKKEEFPVQIKKELSIIKQPKLVTFGAPSYGKYTIPNFENTLGSLTSKKYLPGAHAYGLNPKAATTLINHAINERPKPVDVFLSSVSFPWIKEYFPWIVKVVDEFTTLQTEVKGCKSKYAYRKDPQNYKILDICQ